MNIEELTPEKIAELEAQGQRVFIPDGIFLNYFLHDNHRVCICQGPIGSGKTAAACARIMRHAQEAYPSKDGIRRTKFLVTRNSYRELETTTLQTWLYWFGHLGTLKGDKPIHFYIKQGDIECELVFLALESVYDIPKIRSIEFTGAWVNENQYFDFEVFGELNTRAGRYPPKNEYRHHFEPGTDERDIKPQWHGVIADQNAPPEDFWTEIMFGFREAPETLTAEKLDSLKRPEEWFMVKQPPAVLPEYDAATGRFTRYIVNEGQFEKFPRAENLKNLPGGAAYYENAMGGKTKVWIDTNLRNIAGALRHGEPVYPEFSKPFHVAAGPLTISEGEPLDVGIDPGRKRCGAVFLQDARDQVQVHRELLVQGTYAEEFGEMLHRFLAKHFPAHYENYFLTDDPRGRRRWIRFHGDPYGDRPQFTAERTSWQILEEVHGFKVDVAAKANFRRYKVKKIDVRKDAVSSLLTKTARGLSGAPRLLIDPQCTLVISGLNGGYHWQDSRTGTEQEIPKVEKNKYSDIVEPLEYAVVGMGLGVDPTAGKLGFTVHDAMPDRSKIMGPRRAQARRAMQRINTHRHGPR